MLIIPIISIFVKKKHPHFYFKYSFFLYLFVFSLLPTIFSFFLLLLKMISNTLDSCSPRRWYCLYVSYSSCCLSLSWVFLYPVFYSLYMALCDYLEKMKKRGMYIPLVKLMVWTSTLWEESELI